MFARDFFFVLGPSVSLREDFRMTLRVSVVLRDPVGDIQLLCADESTATVGSRHTSHCGVCPVDVGRLDDH